MAEFETPAVPQAFIWRRLHSLLGLWLVIFLTQHLFVNSQAALFIGDDGKGFIQSANFLESLPYLPILEFLILGLPLLIHTVWGILYLFTAKYNSYGNNGKTSYLPYSRNKAYTWQRITAWLLVIGIGAHVVHMRFVERPVMVQQGADKYYLVKVDADPGIHSLAERLNVELFDQYLIRESSKSVQPPPLAQANEKFAEKKAQKEFVKKTENVEALTQTLQDHEVVAVANNFGTAELLMLRETFKMPIMLVLYTLLVLTAVYHAFNGLWTFCISWGMTLNQRSQKWMLNVSIGLMVLVGILGLSAVWLTYWVNLKH